MQPDKPLELPEYLEQGEYARLIPVVADTSREQRITSAVMAAFMSVEEYGRHMLQMVGAPATKTSKIHCCTEVIFKKLQDEQQKFRPDGLITVKAGAKSWTAIIEAKIGGTDLNKEQIEAYLDLARIHKVDAVITISNQFAAIPTHHPVKVNKQKVRTVSLYHWSWTAILSEAILLADYKGISDPDQAYILRELIRYLKHPSSKVASFSRMSAGWKDLCTAVQQDMALSRNQQYVIDGVKDWHQLVRYISLKMSLAVGKTVSVVMTRAQERDPSIRMQDDIATLVASNRLESIFDVPNAAARIKFTADIKSRTFHVSMRLKSPTDKSRSSALVNWAIRQLSKCEDQSLIIRAIWPGRVQDTGASLEQLRENPRLLINANPALMPVAFDFVRVIDVAGRFRGASTFVESAVNVVPEFYGDIGQHLRAWIAPAPKYDERPIELVEKRPAIEHEPRMTEGEHTPDTVPTISTSIESEETSDSELAMRASDDESQSSME